MSFRTKLLVTMMLVVSAVVALALFFSGRKLAGDFEKNLDHAFQGELASLHQLRQIRQAALLERCRVLVRKPRIHAALEDDALDILYLSARDELRDVMQPGQPSTDGATRGLQAKFYRFLDRNGAVIPAPEKDAPRVGQLTVEDEKALSLKSISRDQQIGYLVRAEESTGDTVSEIIAMPVISSETDEVIAMLVLGFTPMEFFRQNEEIKSGIWLNGRLHLPALSKSAHEVLSAKISSMVTGLMAEGSSLHVELDGIPHLVFYKQLNPGSLFPPVYEVCVYPLGNLINRQKELQFQILGAGALLLLVGYIVSHVFSARLSRPVEQLAHDSEENQVLRRKAESALETTNEELRRSERFSADASHQLKTPLTIIRAGLEEMLARPSLSSEQSEEISSLVHQTYRLSGVIEDLLLLSRMEAGRLRIDFSPINLTQLIEGWLDDLNALPDHLHLTVESSVPNGLHISGEKRYVTLILQNLLENARKYNVPGGRLHIAARTEGDRVLLTIGNTGQPIPTSVQEHLFERFSRGSSSEKIPGHGLGLNLARELARFHHGDLRLIRSDADWTEFEVTFLLASPPPSATSE